MQSCTRLIKQAYTAIPATSARKDSQCLAVFPDICVRLQQHATSPALDSLRDEVNNLSVGSSVCSAALGSAACTGEFEEDFSPDAASSHAVAEGEDRGLVGLSKSPHKPKPVSGSKPSPAKRQRRAEDPEVARAEMAELEASPHVSIRWKQAGSHKLVMARGCPVKQACPYCNCYKWVTLRRQAMSYRPHIRLPSPPPESLGAGRQLPYYLKEPMLGIPKCTSSPKIRCFRAEQAEGSDPVCMCRMRWGSLTMDPCLVPGTLQRCSPCQAAKTRQICQEQLCAVLYSIILVGLMCHAAGL